MENPKKYIQKVALFKTTLQVDKKYSDSSINFLTLLLTFHKQSPKKLVKIRDFREKEAFRIGVQGLDISKNNIHIDSATRIYHMRRESADAIPRQCCIVPMCPFIVAWNPPKGN